jgi:hypothetical protein
LTLSDDVDELVADYVQISRYYLVVRTSDVSSLFRMLKLSGRPEPLLEIDIECGSHSQ